MWTTFHSKRFLYVELRKNSNEATTFGNIPAKILKQSSKSCSDTLQKFFNDALKDEQWCAGVTSVFKKDDPGVWEFFWKTNAQANKFLHWSISVPLHVWL